MGFKKHAKNRQLMIQLDADTQLPMHYQEWGEKDNPEVLICVHGLTRNSHDFDFLAKQLAKDFRIICPDIFGRGESQWLPTSLTYGYPVYVQQMKAFIDKLQLSQVNWLGTSMGGLIGLMLNAESPKLIKRLVLNDIGYSVPLSGLQQIAAYIGQHMIFADMNQVELYLRETYAGFGNLSDKHWQHLATYATFSNQNKELQLACDPAIAEQFHKDLAAQSEDINLAILWNAVNIPCLLLRGKESPLLTAGCAADMAKHSLCSLIELEDVGHAPSLMKKKQIAMVRDFLFSRVGSTHSQTKVSAH